MRGGVNRGDRGGGGDIVGEGEVKGKEMTRQIWSGQLCKFDNETLPPVYLTGLRSNCMRSKLFIISKFK